MTLTSLSLTPFNRWQISKRSPPYIKLYNLHHVIMYNLLSSSFFRVDDL